MTTASANVILPFNTSFCEFTLECGKKSDNALHFARHKLSCLTGSCHKIQSYANRLLLKLTPSRKPKTLEERAETFILKYNSIQVKEEVHLIELERKAKEILHQLEKCIESLYNQVKFPDNMYLCEEQIEIYKNASATQVSAMIEQTHQNLLTMHSKRVERLSNLNNYKANITASLFEIEQELSIPLQDFSEYYTCNQAELVY